MKLLLGELFQFTRESFEESSDQTLQKLQKDKTAPSKASCKLSPSAAGSFRICVDQCLWIHNQVFNAMNTVGRSALLLLPVLSCPVVILLSVRLLSPCSVMLLSFCSVLSCCYPSFQGCYPSSLSWCYPSVMPFFILVMFCLYSPVLSCCYPHVMSCFYPPVMSFCHTPVLSCY